MNTVILKQRGARPSEPFHQHKLHQSILAACLSVRTPEKEAEIVAGHVCNHVRTWLEQKAEVTSADLRRIAGGHLRVFHPDAAYLYEQHRLVL